MTKKNPKFNLMTVDDESCFIRSWHQEGHFSGSGRTTSGMREPRPDQLLRSFFLQKIRLLAIGRVYGDPRAIHPFPFLNPTFQLLIYFRRPDPPFYFQAFLWRGSVNGAKLSAFGCSGQVRATEMSPPGSPDLDFFNSTMSSYQPVDKYGCFIYFLFYFLRSPFLLKAVIWRARMAIYHISTESRHMTRQVCAYCSSGACGALDEALHAR